MPVDRPRRVGQLLITTDLLLSWIRDGVPGYLPIANHLPEDAFLAGAHTPAVGAIGLVITSAEFPDHYPEADRADIDLKSIPILAPVHMKPAHLYDCPLSLN
jgi:hypothetical protein